MYGELIIALSILTFFISMIYSSYVGTNDIIGIFVPTMTDGLFWLKILFCVICLEAVDIVVNIKKRFEDCK